MLPRRLHWPAFIWTSGNHRLCSISPNQSFLFVSFLSVFIVCGSSYSDRQQRSSRYRELNYRHIVHREVPHQHRGLSPDSACAPLPLLKLLTWCARKTHVGTTVNGTCSGERGKSAAIEMDHKRTIVTIVLFPIRL